MLAMSFGVSLSKRPRAACAFLEKTIPRFVAGPLVVSVDRLVLYDGADPRRCLQPDVFVRVATTDDGGSGPWKTWERGAPEVAFEVLSPVDTPEPWPLQEKLKRYRALGVRELFVFNIEGKPGKRLRAWDRVDWDLVEREVEGDRTASRVLDVDLVVTEREPLAVALELEKREKRKKK